MPFEALFLAWFANYLGTESERAERELCDKLLYSVAVNIGLALAVCISKLDQVINKTTRYRSEYVV